MLVLNFSHPLTADHLTQLQALTGRAVERVVDVPVQFDVTVSFVAQVGALVDGIGLSSVEWQTTQILVNPPALNFITAVLLAELHGRMGYFPPMMRLRPVSDSLPPRFEVAEIINLQTVREDARLRR
ncbi:MAG: hypothetical protein BWY52_02605 [Chloroflexi bacterium ADurb.Bin325]|nr:MAG: hypothetical protein BWY52_02605 [Chloroflexi bacterium ADurb.Bin325]